MNDEIEEPDWITDMDKEILEVLSSQLILTPSIIAENIGRSRKGVSNRINSLQAGGLVEKVDRGKYRITSEGQDVLELFDLRLVRSRRAEIAERKLIQNDLGVSKEEYQAQVQKEHQKIQEEEESYEDALQEAFDRVEDRLKEEQENGRVA